MNTTTPSLLEQLRQTNNQAAWARFVQLYAPLLHHWSQKLGLQSADADNLVQEVLLSLVDALPRFNYKPGLRFRGWLWTVMINKHRRLSHRTAGTVSIDAVEEPTNSSPELDLIEEAEYRQYLVDRALRLMQVDFEPTTWQACWQHVVEGKSAATVATHLGISVNAVHLAKARVLRRLRQELSGLLD